MSGLTFPSNAAFQNERSQEHGTPFTNGDDIPIDPALSGNVIDPAIMGESSASASHLKALEYTEVQPSVPFQQPYSPSRQYSQEPQQYSQGPQGDPFAPQVSYVPITELAPPPQKPQKKKRRPRREEECGFCSGNDLRNKNGVAEPMVSCEDCGRSGHPSCMPGEAAAIIHQPPWRCTECKICEACQTKGDEERILLCDFCDKGWHMDCLPIPLKDFPPGRWHCPACPPILPNDIYCDPSTEPIQSGFHPPQEHYATTHSPSHHAEGSGTHNSDGEALVIEVDHETPVRVKTKGRPRSTRKGKAPMIIEDATDGERHSPHPPPFKRMRFRVSSPSPLLRITLRLPSRGSKGRERDDEEEQKKGLFDGILSENDRDTTRSSVDLADKQRFEKSRFAAEMKLAPPPPPIPSADENQVMTTPGPSTRPLRSSIFQPLPLPTTTSTPASASPAPSTPGAHTKGASSHPPLRIRAIRFGQFDIQTWYDAPFPEEYANVPDGRMWICEFCLKYMKSRFGAVRHRMKCKARHPPGDEIYRDGSVSIFEVDGRKNKIYCQNLCLLSKMFLDHKSLFYDVEPFLFYVMTEVDDVGARFVGYFSKEKYSPKDYNVSCIMTLPVRQRQGWGNLLIDFSYLLSKKEQRSGSPEKPLSGLGALGYRNYWTLAVMRYLESAPDHPKLEDISAATAMTIEDICTTLMQQDMIFIRETTPPIIRPSPGQSIKFPKGRKNGIARRHLQRVQTQDDETAKVPFVTPKYYDITWDQEQVAHYLAAWEKKGHPRLRPERLQWCPFLTSRTKKSESDVDAPVTSITKDQPTSVRASSSAEVSTPKGMSSPLPDGDQISRALFDALPLLTSEEGDKYSTVSYASSPPPGKASQVDGDSIDRCEWADSPSLPKRRLGQQSTRSSSVPTVSQVASNGKERAFPRSGSARPRRRENPVAEDEALAAKLEWEERRSSRLLRPRSEAGSVKVKQTASTSNSGYSSPRKRLRVESSPEADLPTGSVNGKSEEAANSPALLHESHQMTNGSEPGCEAVLMTEPMDGEDLPSTGHCVVEAGVDEADPGWKREDIGIPLDGVTNRQDSLNDEPESPADTKGPPLLDEHETAKMELDVGGVSMQEDGDADADGESDEDAEGELDVELLGMYS